MLVFNDHEDLPSAAPLTFDTLRIGDQRQPCLGAPVAARFHPGTPLPISIYTAGWSTNALLAFLDAWLVNAWGTGTVDELYRYRMLGQVPQVKPPRWSLARVVLVWIDCWHRDIVTKAIADGRR